MLGSTRLPHALSRRLFTIGALVAVVAQLAVVVGPMSEAREGRSTASHVERAGTATHYAHNDATCATCQARTLHGITVRVPPPAPARILQAMAISAGAERFASADLFPQNSPRAPPSDL